MWIMNLETIKSEQFRHAFKIWWDNWKIEKNKYSDIREWWDLTKNKIKLLTMEISRNLNCKQNKKVINRLERKLDKLKLIANETDEISTQIKQLEGLIKNYYNKKTEAAKIRSRVEEGEKSTRYFFNLEKKRGQEKLWYRNKTTDGNYKYDIDSIMNEQVDFYSKLFQSEGWDENIAHELTRYIVNKLDKNEKEKLDEDIDLDEISKVIKILKPNKSPGEDGIISEFYQLFWQDIKNKFFEVIEKIFKFEYTLSASQYKVLTLLHKGGERENIKNWRPLNLLNCDYKIISKLLAERLKNVLTKLIHPDQNGFVKGRNTSEANRMIQDIIQYADKENEEGIIVFLDQQKAFDRVEWGRVDFVFKTYNFGEKYRGWIQMLVKNATTSIKTNGFVSKLFSISRSCRQGCPVAPTNLHIASRTHGMCN
jgi:hypothetical protein